MSFILLSFFSLIPFMAAFLLFGLKQGKVTYTLVLFFFAICAWQLSISVLYGGEMLSESTIERLFRLFRIGAISFVPLLFYLAYDLLYYKEITLSIKKKRLLEKVINKKTLWFLCGWSAFVYGIGWTRLGIVDLQKNSVSLFKESLFYPNYGVLGWTFSLHILLIFIINLITLYLAWNIINKHLRNFLRILLVSLNVGYLFGVLNLSPKSPLFQGVLALLIVVMAVLAAYVKMNNDIIAETNKRLINQKSFLKKVIDMNPNFIYAKDRFGNYSMVNAALARLYQTEPEKMVGKNEMDFYSDRSEAERIIKEDSFLLDKLEKRIGEKEQLYDGENNIYTVQMTKKPVFFSENHVELLCVANDITELERNEEYIRRAEKLNIVGQLAAGVAHEIRNPLTSLKGFIQLIEQEHNINPSYLNIMLTELDRINFVASELMVVAKPEVTSKEKVLLKELLQDVVELLNTHAMLNSVIIQIKEVSDNIGLMGNANQLKQVFINVLKNGIEASPEGGTITIQSKVLEEKMIEIKIIDQGCGISKQRMGKLGEPFYTNKEKGTGLGLMVSMRIVKEHSGEIEFVSEEGRGTTIILRFPRSFKEAKVIEIHENRL
jgi:signal transduction histidine kinase